MTGKSEFSASESCTLSRLCISRVESLIITGDLDKARAELSEFSIKKNIDLNETGRLKKKIADHTASERSFAVRALQQRPSKRAVPFRGSFLSVLMDLWKFLSSPCKRRYKPDRTKVN